MKNWQGMKNLSAIVMLCDVLDVFGGVRSAVQTENLL